MYTKFDENGIKAELIKDTEIRELEEHVQRSVTRKLANTIISELTEYRRIRGLYTAKIQEVYEANARNQQLREKIEQLENNLDISINLLTKNKEKLKN